MRVHWPLLCEQECISNEGAHENMLLFSRSYLCSSCVCDSKTHEREGACPFVTLVRWPSQKESQKT